MKFLRQTLLLCLFLSASSNRAPTDIDRMNRLADEYNAYVTKLRAGIVDVKQWDRVEREWRNLTK